MHTKATVDPVMHTGDLVQVFIINVHNKRGKGSSPRIVTEVDFFLVPSLSLALVARRSLLLSKTQE